LSCKIQTSYFQTGCRLESIVNGAIYQVIRACHGDVRCQAGEQESPVCTKIVRQSIKREEGITWYAPDTRLIDAGGYPETA
jgi:hypothetical protein